MTFNYNIFSLEWSRSVSLHCSCVGLQVFSNCPFGWLALCHSQMSLHDYKEAEKSALKGTAQSRSLFSALFQTFCLTARAYLNTQKYGLFCSLSIHGLKKQIPHYSFVHIYISKHCNLRYVKTGSKKRATCFGALQQKELNSYVLRFYANESNLSCSKSGWCWLRIVVAESREKFYLLQQSLYMLRVLPAPRQTCNKEHNSHIWGDSCVYYPFRSQYSYHANCSNPICFKTGLTVGGKTRNIAF